MHISNIYADNELDENRTYKKFLLVRQEGNRQVKRNIDHYNLDIVIALGYRVQSQIATRSGVTVIFYSNRRVCLLKAYETDKKHGANFIV